MKNVYSIVILLVGISLIITTFIQPLPCKSIEYLEKKKCSYLTVLNNKNNHSKYKVFFYLYPILGIICIILSIVSFYKK